MRKIINIITVLMHRYLYRTKVKFQDGNRISFGAKIYDSVMGRNNYFGPNVIINYGIIGNYCSIAPNVIIGGMEHDYNNYSTSTKLFSEQKKPKTIIEDDVWIGANAVIKKGVKIGKGAIIGASTIVLKDVPSLAIVVGNPGKVKRMRFTDEIRIKQYSEINFSKEPKEILLSIEEV